MSILEIMIMDLVFILFPYCLYIIYEIYNKTFDVKKMNLFLDFSLISSFYLILKYKISIENSQFLMIGVPFLLALIKKRNISVILLALFLITYYKYFCGFNILGLLLEYSLYLAVYYFYKNEKINNYIMVNIFIAIKLIFLLFYKFNLSKFIIIIILYIVILNLLVKMINKSDSILNFQRIHKELQCEKNFRMSIFKITHEIKNPITVCKGYIDMFDPMNPKKSKKYINIIESEINRVLLLLEDFLSINKIKIEKEIMDINLLLSEITENYKYILKEKNIKYEFIIPDDELYIEADYNRLGQVIINVIKNGTESIEKDGIIRLYTKVDNNYIKIIVEDNGCGMDEEELKQIKNAFFTTKKNGTGLGIFLSNEIIKAHHGSLKYYSNKGRGTKVIIKLPIK